MQTSVAKKLRASDLGVDGKEGVMDWLPKHECGLYLTHNEHRDSYEQIEQWIVDQIEDNEWVSDEERERAIASDSVWVLQWYPTTPIGSYKMAASSLEAIHAAVQEQFTGRSKEQ